MVELAVHGDSSKLRITIAGAGEKQARLMEALQECAEGRCTCPTSQYEKLQAVDISRDEDQVGITLTAKTGDAIDRRAIDKCLEYIATQISTEPDQR